MARVIETVLKLTNESEYRTALKNSAAELRVLKTELDQVSSEYRNNANSMEALTRKGDALRSLYEAQQRQVSALAGALEKATETRDRELRTMENLRSQYEAAQKALDAYGEEVDESNEGYQQAKSNVAQLRDEIIAHEKSMNASTASVNKYQTQLNRASVELDKLEDQQAENTRLLDEAKQSADGCATSIDRYGNAVRDAASGTDQSVSAVDALASAMVASGIQQEVEDLAAAMMECSQAAANFELAMATVGTLADTSILSEGALKSGILEMSSALGQSASDIADAAYQALSAGVDTANVLTFTRQATELSVAGFTSAATAVDVLSTVLNAYGMSAEYTEAVASKLVKTQDLGKITVDDLGKSLGRVIPSAAAYGVNLDNIAAAYANMTASGINAENTTTYLSTMLDELADSGSAVAEILLDQTGKSFAELMADGTSLGDVLAVIGKAVNNDAVQFSGLWSSTTAGKSALALFNSGAEKFNQTLFEMETSSGSVATNYAKLADTSDYASRRMETASENLKIAVGDQLNPVLDKLRSAGSGIMEMAAETVDDNPALVSAITGVVTALGLLAAGLSALMVVKSVTAAMHALNITLAANPAGLVAVAIAGLAAAVATFVTQTETASQRMDALTESSRKLAETVAAGNQSYEDTVVSTNAAVEMVTQYVEQLEALEQQGLETLESQIEYQMILDKINALMPEINAEMDEQTHTVKGGTEALLEQAQAWKLNAQYEAAYARYKDDIAAMTNAEYDLAKNRVLLNAATEEGAEITAKLEENAAALNAARQRQSQLMSEIPAQEQVYSAELREVSREVKDLESAEKALTMEMLSNHQEQRELSEAIDRSTETIAANRDQVSAAEEAMQSFANQIADSSDLVAESVADTTDVIQESLEETEISYEELWKKSRDSLDGQIGLFEKVSQKCETSTADMIANLQSQKEAFENYATNIQLAMERGIDIGLVQELSDGSVASMQILAELVSATDDQIEELNAIFAEKMNAADIAADEMTRVSQAVQKGLTSAEALAVARAESMGAETVNGLIRGVESKSAQYAAVMAKVADGGAGRYAEVNEINSPSKRYQKLASYDVAGLITQYQADTPKLQAAVTDMADAGYVAQIRSRRAAIPSIVSVASSGQPSGSGQTLQLLQQILAAIKAGKVIALDSGTLVGQTADQYNSAFGNLQFLTDRGAI